MLEAGHPIEFAAYQGLSSESATRFPQEGFITGDIKDLVDFIRPVAQATDAIIAATDEFEDGVNDAAAMLLDCAKDTEIGQSIGTLLRQPWPAYPTKELTVPAEIKQERDDQKAREQTAKMTVTMLINALAFQQNLAGFTALINRNGQQIKHTVKSLRQVRGKVGYHPDNIIMEWENILSINYLPIFQIARQLLLLVPPPATAQLLERMASTANAIQDAMRQNDVAGTLFQRLIADRQTLATYYTRPESTTLAAYLAVPEELDWGKPKTFKNYRIADYACGTGGLVLAAYQRIRELHRNHGGNPDKYHAHMMEEGLTACDIMPAAVHLTSSLLSSVAPRVRYKSTRNVLYPYGATRLTDNQGNPIPILTRNGKTKKHPDGSPMYRMHVDLGSLDLLNLRTTTFQAVLPLKEHSALGGTEEESTVEVEMVPWSQDLVIMNPPFTTPTNHAADHAKAGNPAFAAFGTTLEEQKAMEEKASYLAQKTVGDGYAGLGSNFAAIAHNMVKPGGHIALILPMSAMLGGGCEGKRAVSWQKLRNLLVEEYNDIIVLSIAQPADIDAAFSADTKMGEVLIIARRLRSQERPTRIAHFVNLAHRPDNKLEAMQTAKAIKKTISNLEGPLQKEVVSIGKTEMSTVWSERVGVNSKWPICRITNIDLGNMANQLRNGRLLLPRNHNEIVVPICNLGELGQVGSSHRSFENAFSKRKGADQGTEWPMLWSRKEQELNRMTANPDYSGSIRNGMTKKAHQLWERVSRLHISAECRFNSNATCAVLTDKVSAGGRSWPNFQMETIEHEKAMCAWLNSTIGLISYWINSNRGQSGRGGTTITAIPAMAVLDLRRLSSQQMKSLVNIYAEFEHEEMLPANEAYRDNIRQTLDRRILTEVLSLAANTIDQLDTLRHQWCGEPTVSGRKPTGPKD